MTIFEKVIRKKYEETDELPCFVNAGKKVYKRTKISTARGYQKKNTLSIFKYEGRYGKGYAVDYNNPASTYFKMRAYYIEWVII